MKRKILLLVLCLFPVTRLVSVDVSLGAGIILPCETGEDPGPGLSLDAYASFNRYYSEVYSLFNDTWAALEWNAADLTIQGMEKLDFSARYENLLYLVSFTSLVDYSRTADSLAVQAALEQKVMFYPGNATVSLSPSLILDYDDTSRFSGNCVLGVFPPSGRSVLVSPFLDYSFGLGSDNRYHSVSLYSDFVMAPSRALSIEARLGVQYFDTWNLFWDGSVVWLIGNRVSLSVALPGTAYLPSLSDDFALYLAPECDLMFTLSQRWNVTVSFETDCICGDGVEPRFGTPEIRLKGEFLVY